MNKKTVLAIAGFAACGLMIAGCSSSTSSAPATPSAASGASPSTQSTACAKADSSGRVSVTPTDTCAEIPAGSFALLYSLARDDIKDGRIEVVSGDKQVAVPLRSPETDGDFLMGIVAEQEGKADIAIYVTPSDGSAEQKVQELTVTGVPAVAASAASSAAPQPEASASSAAGATGGSGWKDTPSVIPSFGG